MIFRVIIFYNSTKFNHQKGVSQRRIRAYIQYHRYLRLLNRCYRCYRSTCESSKRCCYSPRSVPTELRSVYRLRTKHRLWNHRIRQHRLPSILQSIITISDKTDPRIIVFTWMAWCSSLLLLRHSFWQVLPTIINLVYRQLILQNHHPVNRKSILNCHQCPSQHKGIFKFNLKPV